MPLLLNVLRNADGPEYRKLRVKAMECAGLIGKLKIFGILLLDIFVFDSTRACRASE